MTDPAPASTVDTQSEPGPITVRVPGPLRPLTDGRVEVVVRARTVDEALDALLQRHPELRRHLRGEGGGIRDYVNLFLNDDDVRQQGGLAAAVAEGDTLTIVASIAGG